MTLFQITSDHLWALYEEGEKAGREMDRGAEDRAGIQVSEIMAAIKEARNKMRAAGLEQSSEEGPPAAESSKA